MTAISFRTALLIAAAAWPCAVHAQSASDTPPPRSEEEIVVTATGVEQRADETGTSITVLTADEIERLQTPVLSDLLLTTPGVSMSRTGGVGTVTTVRLRGAESGQTLVVIDGVRVNDPSAPDGAFDFASLLTLGVDRVEVLRGPASVPWGSQAIGGVVNVITRRPDEGLQGRARAEYGYHVTIVAQGGLSYGGERVRATVDAGYFDTDGISAAAIGTERDGYERWGANGRFEFDLTPEIGIDLRGYWSDGEVDIDGFPAPAYTLADTADYATSQELYGYAGLNADLLDGRFANRLAFSIADINRNQFDPLFSDDEALYIYNGRSERYEYRGDLTLVDQVRAVIGAEHENIRFFDGADTYRTNITSVFGELIVRPVEMLTLTAGVRHDDHEQFGGNTVFAANGALALPTGTIVRASYGEGFKAPSLFQLYAPFLGTPTLRPEEAESWDAGVEQQLVDGRLSLAATWFHRDTTNQIDYDLATFTYQNIAATEAQGLEVALKMQPNDDWLFNASYTYLDAENRSPGFEGLELQRRPEDTVSVAIDYAPETGPSFGATITHVGASFNDVTNLDRLEGYVLASIRAGFRIADRYELYGRIENLFDEEYQIVRGYGTPGRAAFVGVRANFD